MADELRGRLERMAKEATSPEDRAWAAGKLREKFGDTGGPVETPMASGMRPGPDRPPGPYASGYAMPVNGVLDTTPAKQPAPDPDAPRMNPAQYKKFMDDVGGNAAFIPWEAQALLSSRKSDLEKMRASQANLVASTAAGGLAGLAAEPVAAMGIGGRMLAAPAVGAVTGAAGQAADAAMQGQPVLPAARSGAEIGALVGGGAHLAGELGGALSKGVRGISEWVKRYGEAADAGLYQTPEMASLPRGTKGIQKAAETQLPRILGRDQELERDATSAYRDAVDPEASKPIDQAALVDKLKQIRFKNLNQDTGQPLNKSLDSALQAAIDEAAPTVRQGEGGAFVGSRGPTVGGTLQNRRALAKKASFGNPAPNPEQETARDTYQAYRQAVREASPTVRAADDAYSAHAGTAARRRDLLFGSENELPAAAGQERPAAGEPSDAVLSGEAPRPPVGKESRAVTKLKRIGDDNEPGLAAQRYLEELAAQDPEFAKALDFIAAKKALEGTRLSLGDALPTDIGGKTGLSGFMPLIKQNLRFLGGTADRAGTFARQMAPQGRLVLPGFIPEIEQAIEDGRAKQRSDR